MYFIRNLMSKLYMVFYQLLSIVKLKLNEFPTSTTCDHLNLQLSSANYK